MARELKAPTKAEPWKARWDHDGLVQNVTLATADKSPVLIPGVDQMSGLRLVIGGSASDGTATWELMLVDYSRRMADGGAPTVIECLSFRSKAIARRTKAEDDGGIYFHQLLELQNDVEFHAAYVKSQSSGHDRRWILSLRSTTQDSGNLYLLDYYPIDRNENF